jgi:hypothetical protein
MTKTGPPAARGAPDRQGDRPSCHVRKGRAAVRVLSVKRCRRPRMTRRNPRLYPRLATSGRQGLSGRCARRGPSPTREKPIQRPAARPDQARAVVGLDRSSSRPPLSCQSPVDDARRSGGDLRHLGSLPWGEGRGAGMWPDAPVSWCRFQVVWARPAGGHALPRSCPLTGGLGLAPDGHVSPTGRPIARPEPGSVGRWTLARGAGSPAGDRAVGGRVGSAVPAGRRVGPAGPARARAPVGWGRVRAVRGASVGRAVTVGWAGCWRCPAALGGSGSRCRPPSGVRRA